MFYYYGIQIAYDATYTELSKYTLLIIKKMFYCHMTMMQRDDYWEYPSLVATIKLLNFMQLLKYHNFVFFFLY